MRTDQRDPVRGQRWEAPRGWRAVVGCCQRPSTDRKLGRKDRPATCHIADSFETFLGLLQESIAKPAHDKFVDAIRFGDVDKVKKLLAQGVDLYANDNEAMFQVFNSGHWEVLSVLLDAGLDRNAQVSLGTSMKESIELKLEVQQNILRSAGPDNPQGIKAKQSVADIEGILLKYFS